MTTHLLDKAFSLIAPHTCLACGREGNLLCYECMKHLPKTPSNCYRCHAASSEYRPCQTCARTSVLTLAFASTSYAEPTAKELVAQLKFSFAYQAAETIAALLAERLRAQRHLLPTEYIVTHVPTATTRMRQRGFDHAQLIARQVARELGAPHASLLARTTQQRQVGAGRAVRLMQAQHTYRARRSWLTAGANVLLIDDVITTGSTIDAAAAALKQAGASQIYVAAFAHA